MIDSGRIADILSPTYPRSPFLLEGERHAENLRVHAKGHYSEDLMDIVRPNEEDQYKVYRRKVFKSPTKKSFSRVVTTLSKVRLAEDWGISFPKEETFRFPENESLQQYVTKNYPTFDSLENWFFSLALQTMCQDPNAVVAVFPKQLTDVSNEYYKPFTHIFATADVVFFEDGNLAVLKDRLPGFYKSGEEAGTVSTVYHVLDSEQYQVWQKVEQDGNVRYYVTTDVQHNIGYLPAFQLGGLVDAYEGGQILWRSWLDPCIDDWDEAVRRYSDHQVNMVLHLHPDRWEISDQECQAAGCTKGKVKEITLRKGEEVNITRSCKVCSGSGKISVRTPFGVKLVRPSVKISQSDAMSIPTPPMGNVQRDIGSLTYLKDEYKDKIRQGLDALNMGFLDQEPGVNSGYAKALDREEMNAFFTEVARHIIHNILVPCYYFVNEWRNQKAVPTSSVRESLMPQLNVPTKFDLVYAQLSAERAKFARENGFSPTITSELELQYAVREFGEGSTQARLIKAVTKLDPLPHKTVDEKLAMVSSRGTSLINYVISCNLHSFLTAAIQENEKFLDLDYTKQMNKLRELAVALIAENNAALVIATYDQPTSGDFGGTRPADGEGASNVRGIGSGGGAGNFGRSFSGD